MLPSDHGVKVAPGGIPRYRKTRAPAFFREGYRPFFFGCAVWAILAIVVWLLILAEWVDLPAGFDPVAWHAHEMIYGFAVAAMAGFLLTAIPNWTGRFPLQGAPLMLLFLLWSLGRAAMAISWSIGALPAALIDMSFLAVFLAVAAREVLAGRNWRNLPALVALLALLVGNGLTHFDRGGLVATDGLGIRLGLAVLTALMAMIGGRVIPSFTRNRLVKMGMARLPAPPDLLDRVGMAIVTIALIGWVLDLVDALEGVLLLAAAVVSAMRLARWRGSSIWRDALVSAMHLGYAWLSFGLMLLGISQVSSSIPEVAALHALGGGAAGTMILAVMARAILAYTGGQQTAGAPIVGACALVQVAALLRVAAGFLPDAQVILVGASGTAWMMAFLVFTLGLGSRLFKIRQRNH
jgi:uncharacterized protein involved in response to NO